MNRQQPIKTTPKGHSQAIIDAGLSEDGRLLATLGQDQVIRLWSFSSTHPLAGERQVAGKAAKGVAFSSDGRYLAAGDDSGVVQVWELDQSKDPMILKGHGHQVWAIAFSPNGRILASGDRAGQVRLWNLTNGTLLRTFQAHEGAVWSLTFRPGGDQLISAGDMQVHLWAVETDELVKKQICGTGTSIYIPSLQPHGMKNVGDEPGAFLCCICNVYDEEESL